MSQLRNDDMAKFVRLHDRLLWEIASCLGVMWPSCHRVRLLQKEKLPLYVIINTGFVSFQYQVLFEAERKGWTGDIALDEIKLTPGSCRQFVVTTTLPPPPSTTKQPTPPVTQGMFCSGERGRDRQEASPVAYVSICLRSIQSVAEKINFILKGYNLSLAWA